MRRHVFRRPFDFRTPRRVVDARRIYRRATWGRIRFANNATSDSYSISTLGDLRGDCLYGEAYVVFWASTESPTEVVDKVVLTTDIPGTLSFNASTPGTVLNGAVQTTSPPAGLWAAIATGNTAVTITCSPQTSTGSPINTSWAWGVLRVARDSSLWPINSLPYALEIYNGPAEDGSDYQVGDVFNCASSGLQYNANSLLFLAGSAPSGGRCLPVNGTYDNWQGGFCGSGLGNGFVFAWQFSRDDSTSALKTATFIPSNTMIEGSGVYLTLFPALPVAEQAAGALHGRSVSVYDNAALTDHGHTILFPYET